MESSQISVAILVMREASASTIYGMHDLFKSANRDWQKMLNRGSGKESIYPILVSNDGLPLSVDSGVNIVPDTSLEKCPEVEVICIPDVMPSPREFGSELFSEVLLDWLRKRYSKGAIIAASCSGPMLLAEAGLLDGFDATVHWAWCGMMRNRYPKITVQEDRSLVISGSEQRLIMGELGHHGWM
ncbi:DJ-1/PfpI family protein [Microbulbifer taiwanensis]|uniref:DJ-1/PfpI family protein n=1 Tax=Microbulbifer taiwanensis TaxID=986746 RepID=UPI003606D4E9